MYDGTKDTIKKQEKLLNLDALVSKLEGFYKSGDTKTILKYAKVLEKKMIDSKNAPDSALNYMKGAIDSYSFLGDYNNIERVLKMGKTIGVPRPKLILSAEPTDEELKVMRMINDIYGAPKIKKSIKRVLTTKKNYSNA